ncbi:hypothetical protein CPLU01_04113 [Colletotrichum plurivorum]|uniref:Uncharacterized protein n=1 Tax=Colletotrichum plurivorum TaxID=2175906 RepID=A0A8H6KRC3_9PEZI|nr:hypothetical protein CPLU01_04113 [Colletotrichum plurivorum]
MSTDSSLSHSQGSSGRADNVNLPQGQCRYILLVSGIKGQRCACVHFSLNRSMPGAICDCGHMACYHVKNPETSDTRHEVELLKQRLQALENELDRRREGGLGGVVARVSELEELVDRGREEIGQEIRGSYRNITRVWQSVKHLELQTAQLNETKRTHSKELENINTQLQQISDRQMELFDADESMEERLEQLESDHDLLATPGSQLSRPGVVVTATSNRASQVCRVERPLPSRLAHLGTPVGLSGTSSSPGATGLAGATNNCGAWTVHVSLLPTFSQPFPFERDTNAYKRCLSRGLHRTVVVGGSDSNSFVTAVTKTFSSLLIGRAWMPLQAKLCDAERLQGLPMLRPLDPKMIDSDYDVEFLRKHCGVCEPSGKIESLYVAMREETLSWHFLRNSPKHIDGLESCWAYDYLLDPNDPVEDDSMDDNDRPSAGDIVPSLPSLKRAASEISKATQVPGAATSENDSPLTKTPRSACLPTFIDTYRNIETI